MELVIVDDASPIPFFLPDDLSGDSRINLIRRENNGGAGAARNSGISIARGELITFLDSDDQMLPDTLVCRMEFAESREINIKKNPLAVVGCGWREVNDKGKALRSRIPVSSTKPLDFFSGCWFCPGSAVLFNRALFSTIGSFDEKYRRLEDVEFFIRFAEAGGMYIGQSVHGVRIEHGSAKSSKDIKHACDALLAQYGSVRHKQSSPSKDNQIRVLRAYLHLEMAKLAFVQGRQSRVITNMVASLLQVPRLSVHLSPGWRKS